MSDYVRPGWDEYFARITEDVATRSTCIKKDRQFGAIVVNSDREIVASGYNGNVRGAEHCEKIGCIKDELGIESGMGHGVCTAVHAEMNALLQAGKNARGGTIYVNGYPCKICARLIANAGINRVVTSGTYSDEEGLKILSDAGVKVKHIEILK